jgi:beta-lactamase class A
MRAVRMVAMMAVSAAALSACVPSSRPPARSAPPPQAQQPWRDYQRPQQPAPTPTPAPRPSANRGDRDFASRAPAGLEETINELWRTFPGKTGISITRIDGGDWSVSRRGDEYFPQQSVSKTWVALTLLSQVDSGRVRLSDPVTITGDDLTLWHATVGSRVQASGSVQMTLGELLDLSITRSDNTANDSILRSVGGSDAVRGFIREHDLGRIRFGPGERLLQSRTAGLEWQQRYSVGRNFQVARSALPMSIRTAALDRYLADPEDGAAPQAITQALAKLARGELLSQSSTRLMIDTMLRVRSGPQRLRAGVPSGWTVAHKTGTGQVLGARSTGYNDIGILTAPDGTRYAVAVMLAETTAPIPDRMQLMQAVSRAVATYHNR